MDLSFENMGKTIILSIFLSLACMVHNFKHDDAGSEPMPLGGREGVNSHS